MAKKNKYRLWDLPRLSRTYYGRKIIVLALRKRIWPLLYHAGRIYRRLVIPHTRIIAVTGTNGKSAAVRALAAMLPACCSQVQNNIATSLTLTLMKIRPWHKDAVLEVSVGGHEHGMSMYASMLAPDIAVVTSLGTEHITAHGSQQVLRSKKAILLQKLKPGGLSILNGDDPNVMWMARHAPGQVLTFGFRPHNDVWAEDIELDWPHGTRFTLKAGGAQVRARVGLVGRHMLYAPLAAAALGLHLGIDLAETARRLEGLTPMQSRLQPVRLPNGAFLLRDEYKSPLETIDAALDLLEQVPAERKVVVMGNISELHDKVSPAYRELGQRVASVADRVLFLGMAYQHFRTGARRGGLAADKITNCHRNVKLALQMLPKELRPGDVVLIKGRLNQRLGRIALGLMGREVGCQRRYCDITLVYCASCPRLGKG